MAELFALLAASFAASTLLPLPSEAVLFVYLKSHPENLVAALAAATVGNTAGGMTSYLIGRLIPPKDVKGITLVKRYGAPALIFAWLPLVGDALCVAAGWLRLNWATALAFMAAGRLARYIGVAFLLA